MAPSSRAIVILGSSLGGGAGVEDFDSFLITETKFLTTLTQLGPSFFDDATVIKSKEDQSTTTTFSNNTTQTKDKMSGKPVMTL